MKGNEKQILELKEQIDDLKQIEKYVAELDKKIQKEKKRLHKLERIADQEYQDIIDLERKTFADFFVDYSEEREKQKEKEKEEYMAAVLDCRNTARTIKSLEFEASVLKEKLLQLPDLESQLKGFLSLRTGNLEGNIQEEKKIKSDELTQNQIDPIQASILESVEQLRGRIIEINTCLDQMLTWSHLLSKYQDNRKRHILKDIASLETIMVWLRSDLVQLKIKMYLFQQNKELDNPLDSTFANYKKSYKRLQRAINDIMSRVVKDEFTALSLSQKCVSTKGLSKSLDYDLKQIRYFLK